MGRLELFYVYELVDPRDARVFYVGKGSGNRLRGHLREARQGRVSRKCEVIRSIIAAGLEIQERVVKRFECEAAAYAFEKRHIARIGLSNLTNLAPGGGGVKAVETKQEKIGPFEARASLLRLWATGAPRKGKLFSEALWRALERRVPRIFEELLEEFGQEAVIRRLFDEYGLRLKFIENNA